MTRRDFYRYGSIVLGGLIKLVVVVPAIAFLISPLRRKSSAAGEGAFEALTSLSQLKVGVPRSFAIIQDQADAWVKYPSEPVGSIWLIRQPAGAKPEVIAFTAECPHLGSAINLSADGKSFLCPCHTSSFDFDGKPKNQVPPRPMDRLDVELGAEPDPKVRVKFQRFRTLAEEKIPLFNQLADWLDDRTGYRALIRTFSAEQIPGGARWRYVFGSTLASVFLIQAFTGVLMMTAYSPSSSSAWGSVYFINNVMWMGWFIRGLHHFGASTVMVLLVLHLLQVLLAGAYRKPREVNWWLGLALLFLIVNFAHTGYQLPWDQKGYWATKVMTNIMGGAPVIGPYLKTIVVGGTEYGNQTITRLFGLHVAILPILMILCLWAHVALARRHGLTPPPRPERWAAETYWPAQSFRNVAFLSIVVAIMVCLDLINGGAPLDAPADPSSADYPARPEWFFLCLFQMLKHFPGRLEWVGSIVIPSTILLILFLLPLLDRILPSKLLHFLACAGMFGLLGGAGYLTVEALNSDAADTQFQEARKKADAAQERALFLAASPAVGIPPSGAGFLLRHDPLTHGHAALEKKCLGCHFFGGQGTGEQTAADLKGFGTRSWVRGLLENPAATAYLGKVPGLGGMVEWKKGSKLKDKELDDVADFVASFARIAADLTPDEWLNVPGVAEHPGNQPFQKECGQCHQIEGFTDGGTRNAPGLFAWGSTQWLTRMIRKPGAPDLYGFFEDKAQMPPFGPDQLRSNDIDMIIRFLHDDYLMPGTNSKASMAASPTEVNQKVAIQK